MKKTKIIKKEELDFDISKIKEVDKIDIFEDRIEINFQIED